MKQIFVLSDMEGGILNEMLKTGKIPQLVWLLPTTTAKNCTVTIGNRKIINKQKVTV